MEETKKGIDNVTKGILMFFTGWSVIYGLVGVFNPVLALSLFGLLSLPANLAAAGAIFVPYSSAIIVGMGILGYLAIKENSKLLARVIGLSFIVTFIISILLNIMAGLVSSPYTLLYIVFIICNVVLVIKNKE